MKTITMLEVRRNTKALVDSLARGEAFTLTYRNRPIGELRPIPTAEPCDTDDPAYDLADLAEDLGGGLSTLEADTAIYGR